MSAIWFIVFCNSTLKWLSIVYIHDLFIVNNCYANSLYLVSLYHASYVLLGAEIIS